MVTLTYCLFIAAVSFLGAKTVWSNYYIWEIPSLAYGAASSLGVITIVSVLAGIVLASSYHRQKVRIGWLAFVRQGRMSPVLAGLAGALFVIALVVPPKRDPVDELLDLLSKKRQDQIAFIARWEELTKFPKHKDRNEIKILKAFQEYRAGKEWSHAQREAWGNRFGPYRANAHTRLSLWAKMLVADNLDRMGKGEEAFALYTEVAKDSRADRYVRWWSYQELGNYHNNSKEEKRDVSAAINNWEQAGTFIDSPGINMNIAVALASLGEFEKANEYYQKALESLQKNIAENQNVSVGENAASLYVNWSIMYQGWAEANARDSAALYRKAESLVSKAQIEDPAYLDAYWAEARLYIALKQFDRARVTIERARAVMAQPTLFDLNRFNYPLLGPKQMAYMHLLVDFHDSNKLSAPSPSTLALCATHLTGWNYSRTESLRDFFRQAKKSGLDMDNDEKQLSSARFIAFLRRSTSF